MNVGESWIEPGCSAAHLPGAVLMLLYGTPVPTDRQSVDANGSPLCKKVTATVIGLGGLRHE
jgi:hypothetical protein